MIQYVEKLFQETKTIILPELGALTITNPDTKEMMFMPYLKHDDGALAGFIAKEAGISEDEAKKMVSDEVHRMLNEIESGKTVSFGNFGSFKKDADGDMIFENSEDEVEATEPAAAPAVEDNKKTEAEAEKKAKEEADAKKAAEAEAKKKAKEEADAKKAADAEAKKKAKEEADAKKAADAEAKKKAKEEADAKKAADAEAKKKAKEEADAKKAAESDAKKSTAKAAVVPPKVEKPKEAPKTEKPKETQKPKEATSKTTVNQVIPDLDAKKEAPKKDDTKKVAPVAAAAAATSATKTPEKNILQKEEIAANQKKLDKLKKDKEAPKKKRKRGVGFYILLGLIFIIVAGGTLVALNYEQAKEYLPFLADSTAAEASKDDENDMLSQPDEEPADDQETTAPETDENEADDEEDVPADNEEVVEPEVVPEDPQPEPTPPVNTGSIDQPYHIVAGVFSEPANAERLVTKIQGMGYPAKTIQRGAQTVVSVQSYATSAEAQAAISSVSDAAPKGWVLYWP